MTTLAVLKARIADELGDRSDLSSQIAYAIADAVQLLRRKRFDFNEGRKTASTTAATEYVTWPAGLVELDQVTLLSGTTPWTLTERSDREIEEWSMPAISSTGQSTDFARFGRQIRLYPIPDAAYTLTFSGLIDVEPALTADSVSNAWTTDGEMLVRQLAKALVCIDVLQDAERAAQLAALVGFSPTDLMRGATPKRRTGRTRARW